MALFKGSRYETVPAFDPDPEGRTDFRGLKPRPIGDAEPILEHSVAMKERLDSLSYHYYREPRAWFRFAEANPEFLFPEDLLWVPDPAEENGRERLAEIIIVPRRQEHGT
jgi:hypothetical protein